MTLQFGNIYIKIIDMFKQKYADYYKYEISHQGFKTIDSVHVESRTKEELIQKIKEKLNGTGIF